MFPYTVARLNPAVQDEWDRLQPEDRNKYIDSMPEIIAVERLRDKVLICIYNSFLIMYIPTYEVGGSQDDSLRSCGGRKWVRS